VSATVTYDPNVRPALITDADLARERIEHLVEQSDIVKVSEEELRWLWGFGLLGADRRSELRRSLLDNRVALQAAGLSAALTIGRAGADLPDQSSVDAATGCAKTLIRAAMWAY
jgi:sugar/nucleoside kinase (ribokinase family)